MKSIYQLSSDIDSEAIQDELTALIDECAVLTDLLATVEDWPRQRLIPFACALDRRMQEISTLFPLLEK